MKNYRQGKDKAKNIMLRSKTKGTGDERRKNRDKKKAKENAQ